MGKVSLSRALFGVLLVINLAAMGFSIGAMIAAEFFTSTEDGMAGSTLVAICGLGGALTGLIAGAVLLWKLADEALLRVTVGAIVLSGISIGLIFLRISK
jgi:hypothetical protein